MKFDVQPWHVFKPYEVAIKEVHLYEFELPEEPNLKFRVNLAIRHFGYPIHHRSSQWNFFSYEIWYKKGDDEEIVGRCWSSDVPLDPSQAVERIRQTYISGLQEAAIAEDRLFNQTKAQIGAFI